MGDSEVCSGVIRGALRTRYTRSVHCQDLRSEYEASRRLRRCTRRGMRILSRFRLILKGLAFSDSRYVARLMSDNEYHASHLIKAMMSTV